MAAVRHAQLAGEPNDPVGAHDGGVEAVEIDAGRNDLQPVSEIGKMLQGIARDVIGDGDHRIGMAWRRSTRRFTRPLVTNGRYKVAIHLSSSRRATSRATNAVAGERAWITVTSSVAQAGGKPAGSV